MFPVLIGDWRRINVTWGTSHTMSVAGPLLQEPPADSKEVHVSIGEHLNVWTDRGATSNLHKGGGYALAIVWMVFCKQSLVWGAAVEMWL